MADPQVVIGSVRWMRTAEVAEALGITRQAVLGLVERKRLPAQMSEYGFYVYDPAVVEAFRADREKRAEMPDDSDGK